MRRLRCAVVRQFLSTVIPCSNNGPCLNRNVSQTLAPELRLNHTISSRKGGFHVTIAMRFSRMQIRRDALIHQRYTWIRCAVHIEDEIGRASCRERGEG